MQSSDITIAPAGPEHQAAIRAQSAATNDAHRARLPHVFRPTNAYQNGLLDMAFEQIARNDTQATPTFHSQLLVACRGDLLLGFVLVIWNSPDQARTEGGSTALIADIATLEDARGQGVAAALLRHLVGLMPENGWDSIVADVWLGNEASHALFTKAGFDAERTEYRLGAPPPLDDNPTQESRQPSPNNIWMVIAITALCILIITSIP